ncbi:Alpha/Beta hydrolase protein [Thelonectria olida]|uniref:Carboxypeptidase n=1 Tax=Thelonectria olida TaxID=1576542 RepID=A0A9P8VWB7_9HYPO|nr:Alpha/Beta hydrolase protein [Thelonectria olida]
MKCRSALWASAALLFTLVQASPWAPSANIHPASGNTGYRTHKSKFSNNQLRVKSWAKDETPLCPGAAAHHTGWADFGHRHIFFWYHEARYNPKDAPLLVWFQGGPGVSSLHGMLYENGPCLADDKNGTQSNQYSWTEYFNVVYLDNPVGVGFSYVDDLDDPESYPSTTVESSCDVVTWLKLFYEVFPHLSTVDLHLSGESYAGRYVPVLASTIVEYNQFLLSSPLGTSKLGSEVIPLRSLMFGNPMIDPAVQFPASYDESCFEYRGRWPPRVDEKDCAAALKHLDACEAALRSCSQHSDQPLICNAARELCFEKFLDHLHHGNTSSYDRRRLNCEDMDGCFPDIHQPGDFLNTPEVIEGLIEAPQQTGSRRTRWSMGTDMIMKRFSESGDGMIPSTGNLARVLQVGRRQASASDHSSVRTIDVMVYVGTADAACDPNSVYEALRGIQWEGRVPFRSVQWNPLPWSLPDGQPSGRVKAVPNLWMVEIEEAGHMVPYDQPETSLRMVKLWLEHIEGTSSTLGGRRGSSEDGQQRILTGW